jgi:hypothetical protein
MKLAHTPDKEVVYEKKGDFVVFNQLGVKVEMDPVTNDDYYAWLDDMTDEIGSLVSGAKIVEKENARQSPPLNTAIYYDTAGHHILPTGALLRTSCNKITHAFCAFKAAQDGNHVRRDHRYVFDGDDKRTIQQAPASAAAVAIVKRLLSRTDIEHPGTHLERHYGIRGEELFPAIQLDDYRYTFFVWLDARDALRCSIDRYHVRNLRIPEGDREWKPVSEVELAIYPRIEPEVARDRRVVALLEDPTADCAFRPEAFRPEPPKERCSSPYTTTDHPIPYSRPLC